MAFPVFVFMGLAFVVCASREAQPAPHAATVGGAGTARNGSVVAAARRLEEALRRNGCRFYDAPLVRDFQRRAGLRPHGFFDEPTRVALSRVLGAAPAVACLTDRGGPRSPEFFWNPPGS